jgi:hypothetical protein
MAQKRKPMAKDDDVFEFPEKKKRGKKVFAIILIIILFSALAAGGVWYWQNRRYEKLKADMQKQIDDLNQKLSDASNNPSQSQNGTTQKDWLSYADQYEGLSFKYPPSWKLSKVDRTKEQKAYSPDWKGPFVDTILTSPSGFKLKLQSHIDGIGGGCDPDTDCPTVNILSIDQVAKLKDGKGLYLVKVEAKDHSDKKLQSREIGLYAPSNGNPMIKVGKYVGFPPYILFPGQGVDGALTAFSGPKKSDINSSESIDYQPNLSASQYFDQEDLQIASDILTSVHF